MKIRNTEIARMIAEKGYDYQEALEGIDAGRTPEEEGEEITAETLEELIEAVCSSFEQMKEFEG